LRVLRDCYENNWRVSLAENGGRTGREGHYESVRCSDESRIIRRVEKLEASVGTIVALSEPVWLAVDSRSLSTDSRR